MIALFQEAIAACNLPFTALLGMVLFYWCLVGLGALDFDIDVIDLDFSDVGDLGDTPAGPINTGGAWITLGGAIGFNRVPIVVWATFLALFLWAGAMLLNHTFNPTKAMLMAVLLVIPNLIGSLLVTRVVVWPLGKVFTAMAEAQSETEKVVGRQALVISAKVDSTYGQVEIANSGAPVRVNARIVDGASALGKGTPVRITAAGPDAQYYFVEPVAAASIPATTASD